MNDRGVELACERDQFSVGSGTTCAADRGIYSPVFLPPLLIQRLAEVIRLVTDRHKCESVCTRTLS